METDTELPRYSASRVNTYLDCPRKWAFRYVEHVPPESRSAAMALGRAVHSALEHFHLELLDGQKPEPKDVIQIFTADFEAELDDGVDFKSNESANLLRRQGADLVFEYVKAYADRSVAAVEVPFTVPLADPETGEVLPYLLHGWFDVLWDGDQIGEIKTSARRFDEGTLARKLQLHAYAYAYRQLHGRDPTIKVVQLLKTRRPEIAEHDVHRAVGDDAWFVHLVAAVARGIEARSFPPKPSWMCGDCEYARACAHWRGDRPRCSEPEPIGSVLERVHLPVF
ncbi:MAG: PD-(D/E)XK nuclease family protein [Sandaracinus sp.]|nr:PD-(D/E)XK nuclease family protein [Sandaracinus sp.]